MAAGDEPSRDPALPDQLPSNEAPQGDAVAGLPIPAQGVRLLELGDGAVLLAFDLETRGDEGRCFDPLEALTPAQRRVVGEALDGLSDEAIASRLGLSRHTVSNHLRAAYKRVGVSSRAELAALVRRRADAPRAV
jgi:DNA-binding CsgD family transcriptional regulator